MPRGMDAGESLHREEHGEALTVENFKLYYSFSGKK